MHLLEIQNACIVKIEDKNPFQSLNQIPQTSYEWFYFDIKNKNSHVVLILSLKDPFYAGSVEKTPGSAYLTWYRDNKLIAYSYSIFNDELLTDFQKKISKFISGEELILNLVLPDFSKLKTIQLNLSIPFKSMNESQQKLNEIRSSKKEHFWQFILNAPIANGSIETREIPKSILKNWSNFFSYPKFYDAVLNFKLKQQSTQREQFNCAHVYFDHNFGKVPLYEAKDNWMWWHCENHENWEVTYFFPKIGQSYYESSNSGSIITTHLNENNKNLLTQNKKFNYFLFTYPKSIVSKIFNKITFTKMIELAPFYLRSISNLNNINSTLEVLIPSRIANPVNQILMKARKINIIKNIQLEKELTEDLSFSEILEMATKVNGKSFYFASLILSTKQKYGAFFIYTICRLIDDATDSQEQNKSNEIGSNFSQKLLEILWDTNSKINSNFLVQLQSRLNFCLFASISMKSVENFIHESRISIIDYELNISHFNDLILGQKMDENFVQPRQFDEFYKYCYRVAGVVGLMMIKIFKVSSNPKALVAAEHLGIAMQITNILRDIKEDYSMGRVYIPQSICNKCSISISDSLFYDLNTKISQKENLVQCLSQKALSYYKSGIDGIPFISKFQFRFCVRLMASIYASILSEIIKNNLIVFQKRVVTSKLKKTIIFFKILIGINPLTAANISLNKNFKEINYEKI